MGTDRDKIKSRKTFYFRWWPAVVSHNTLKATSTFFLRNLALKIKIVGNQLV